MCMHIYYCKFIQMLTFRVIIHSDPRPLRGARDTAVDLRNLERGFSFLFKILTVLPDILIWEQNGAKRHT